MSCPEAVAGTRDEIAVNDWSLTPGRYVGVAEDEGGDEDFEESMTALHEELKDLNAKAVHLYSAVEIRQTAFAEFRMTRQGLVIRPALLRKFPASPSAGRITFF